MTAADKFTAKYIPPPPPAAGHIQVKAPTDAKGRPICANLSLSPEHAEQLKDALEEALLDYETYDPPE